MTVSLSTRSGNLSFRSFGILLAVVALAAFACGSEDTTSDDTEAGGGAVEITDLVVVASDFEFEETDLQVEPGGEGEITFTNEGEQEHTFSIEELDVEVEAEGGQTETAALEVPNDDVTYEFFCEYHPDQMRGELVVGAGGKAPTGDDDKEKDDDSGGRDY